MFSRRKMMKAAALTPIMLHSIGRSEVIKQIEVVSYSHNQVSLSQWSFHRAILGNSKSNYAKFIKTLHTNPDDVLQGELHPTGIIDMAVKLNVRHLDLVNILFFGHALDLPWLKDFKTKALDNNIAFQLLMCDETGALGASSKAHRKAAIENHLPWLECAATLGCKQLRVNAYGDGTYLQQLDNCAESLTTLAELAGKLNIELLVENHGYASNNGAWLAMLMEHANHPNLGVFTDLDNFFMGGWNIKPERRYDRIQGLIDLQPYTRGISAKSHNFDSSGNETTIDYAACLAVLLKSNITGTISAEYEGENLSEYKGSKATINLIKKTLLQYS